MGEIWACGSFYSVALGQAHFLSLKDVSIELSQEASLQPRIMHGVLSRFALQVAIVRVPFSLALVYSCFQNPPYTGYRLYISHA